MATGMAAAFAKPAFGQQAQPAENSCGERRPPEFKNPVTEYPPPAFEKQEQEWPGLASRMTPRPDNGEELIHPCAIDLPSSSWPKHLNCTKAQTLRAEAASHKRPGLKRAWLTLRK